MFRYSFYVGTTPTHHAHNDAYPGLYGYAPPTLVWGVWDGVTEPVAIYDVRLDDDAAATRFAASIASLTGNDAIMVNRDASRTGVDARDTRYRVRSIVVQDGDRTLLNHRRYDGDGYRFTPDAHGNEISFLVAADGQRWTVDGAPDTGCDWRDRMPTAADNPLTRPTPEHECHVDCTPSLSATGGTVHELYPSAPDRSAGRYQAELNATMDRRAYRASGQDESRNVRAWNRQRVLGRHWDIRLNARLARES